MIYFGDIHNHNELGYGKGSLRRSIEIARSHLDFYAFTGHSSWHDMPVMEGGREQIWIDGFAKLEQAWPDVQQLTADSNVAGEFVTFLGFEWHSSAFGDQCILFPDDFQERVTPDNIDALHRFCQDRGALILPHHLSYPTGHRGVNWAVFDEKLSPVVEVFSEHGCSMEDRAPYDYFSHSTGPRVTANTVHAGLAEGCRFGFTASSDSHRGFPGGWDEGITAVHADSLSRKAILDAIRRRRTYAVTGDRIRVWAAADGEPMGASLNGVDEVELTYSVEARDEIDLIDVVQDGRVVHRSWPRAGGTDSQIESLQIRIEWGWGPWLDMDLDRIADWGFEVRLEDGRINDVFPCCRSGPFDEDRRHSIDRKGNGRLVVRSYSGRKGAYRGNPNHSVVISVEAAPGARLEIDVEDPGNANGVFSISELQSAGRAIYTGPYPAECMLIHRPVGESLSRLAGSTRLTLPRGRSWAYLKVRQKNGQLAWTSPFFFNYD